MPPEGVPKSGSTSRTVTTRPFYLLTFAWFFKSLTHEGNSWKPRAKKSIRGGSPWETGGPRRAGHIACWASSLGVCTGVAVNSSITFDQTGNISRKGPKLIVQHPDPGVCATPQPSSGLSCLLRAQEKMPPPGTSPATPAQAWPESPCLPQAPPPPALPPPPLDATPNTRPGGRGQPQRVGPSPGGVRVLQMEK